MKKPMLVVLWVIATAATTAIAFFAVNAAGTEVTDRPLTTVVAAARNLIHLAGKSHLN